MKKLVILCAVLLVISALTSTVFAANQSAFSKINVTKDVEVIDDTKDQGGNNKPIAFVEGYGIGYSQIDDIVVFRNIDFGKNGANKFIISFQYGATSGESTLAIYIDDYKTAKPICELKCTPTGGWKLENAKEFSAACSVAGGVHTVYVKFTNKASGSFGYIRFEEAPATTAATTKAAATSAAKAPAAAAAKTPDMAVVIAAVAVTAASAAIVIKRKH